MRPLYLRKRGEAVIGLLLAALGVSAALIARNYPSGSDGVPGSTLYPLALGVLLAITGLGLAVSANRSDTTERVDLFEPHALIFIALIGAYAFFFETAGFLVASPLFLFASFVFVGHVPWLRAAIIAALTTAVMWGVFVKALGVSLPGGLVA